MLKQRLCATQCYNRSLSLKLASKITQWLAEEVRFRGVRLSPPARHTICSVRSAQTGAPCFFFSSPFPPSSADTSLQASGVVRDRYQIFRWRVHSSDDYNNPSWKMWVCLLFVVYLCIHWQFSNDTNLHSENILPSCSIVLN